MKRRTSLLAIAGTVGLLGLSGAGAVSAVSGDSSSSDSLVDRLVQKFNLDKNDVQAVFDEEKYARDTERRAEMSERLQDAVDDGDLTDAQKQLIEAKKDELETARESQRDQLEQWAEDNDIDEQYLMGGGMRGGHGKQKF